MKGILFNTEMVQAILDGRKSQTRRNPFFFKFLDGFNPEFTGYSLGEYSTGNIESGVVLYSKNRGCWRAVTEIEKTPYVPGDIVYIRETWKTISAEPYDHEILIHYIADDFEQYVKFLPVQRYFQFEKYLKKNGDHPNIFMPEEAARIFLKVTGVRVERIQDITSADAFDEGFEDIGKFEDAWLDIYEDNYRWEANPWIWIIEFERCERPNEN